MKITIEFDGEDAQRDAEHALKAKKYLGALQEISQYLRQQRKYTQLTKSQSELLERIDLAFVDAIDGIDLYE